MRIDHHGIVPAGLSAPAGRVQSAPVGGVSGAPVGGRRASRTRAGGMIRFAALGDSTTFGLGDPVPGVEWRGWAAILASSLAAPGRVEFHNLAATGARAADVAGGQLAAALPLRPHVASVLVGMNDTLRNTFDVRAIGDALRATVATLTARNTVVLTARLPEPGRMLGLPAALARPLARRISAVNAVTDAVAAHFATVHVDLAGHPATYDRRMWSVDRLHPSERGHRLLARCFADALAGTGFPIERLPKLEPTNPEPTRLAQAYWMASRGTRWVLDRSTDLLPQLLAIAATEWWYGLRGVADRCDDHLRQEIADALARMEESVIAA